MSSYFSVPHSHSHARIHKIWIVSFKSSSIAVFRSPPSLPPSSPLLTGDTQFPTSSSLPPSSFPPSFPLRSPSALVPDNVVDEDEGKDDKGHEPEHVPAGGGGEHLVQPPHGRAHQPVRPRKPIALRVDIIEEKGVEGECWGKCGMKFRDVRPSKSDQYAKHTGLPSSLLYFGMYQFSSSLSRLTNPLLPPSLPPPLPPCLLIQIRTMSSRRVFWERTSVPMSIVSCGVG